MGVIGVKNLVKEYRVQRKEEGFWAPFKNFFARKHETVEAVKGISFSIDEGELVGFIGPNGAGKTTTLKCLSGLLYPDQGKISVLGFKPFERDYKYLKQISLVMGQKNQLWWDLPATETFKLNKEIYDISDSEYRKTLNELTDLLEIKEEINTPVKKLSLGQRMKCELVAALIHKPKVLFLDEPTIGLDVVMQKKLREFIKEYNEKFKATIILTSHYMGDVEALCKRVIIINKGQIIYDGQLLDLVKKHAPYKLVSVILQNRVKKELVESLGEVKKYEYPELVLRVPIEKASDMTAKIFKKLPVEDMNIEDPEMEDVIREIFTE